MAAFKFSVLLPYQKSSEEVLLSFTVKGKSGGRSSVCVVLQINMCQGVGVR
jgi:hypothetical protein